MDGIPLRGRDGPADRASTPHSTALNRNHAGAHATPTSGRGSPARSREPAPGRQSSALASPRGGTRTGSSVPLSSGELDQSTRAESAFGVDVARDGANQPSPTVTSCRVPGRLVLSAVTGLRAIGGFVPYAPSEAIGNRRARACSPRQQYMAGIPDTFACRSGGTFVVLVANNPHRGMRVTCALC
jgi:hypothetical protein